MANVVEDFARLLDSQAQEINKESILDEAFVFSKAPTTDLDLLVARDSQRISLATGIDKCLNKVFRKVIVYGDGGAGKTSVVNVAVEVAKKGLIKKYKPICLNLSDYVKGFGECYSNIISNLCWFIQSETPNPREPDEISLASKCDSIEKDLALWDFKTSGEINNKLIEKGLISLPANVKPENKEIIKVLLGHLKKPIRIMLVLDDAQILADDRGLLQNILDSTNLETFFVVMVMQTKAFLKLKSTQDELIKDAFSFEIPALEEKDCKEMLRRRIFVSKRRRRDVKNPINYQIDLLPFRESVVQLFAVVAKGNAIKFIDYLHSAYLSRDLKANVIDETVVSRVLDIKPEIKINLTDIQNEVLEFIKQKGESTSDEVALFRKSHGRGKGKLSAYFILQKLFELKLVDRTRKGKKIYYIFKPSEIPRPKS